MSSSGEVEDNFKKSYYEQVEDDALFSLKREQIHRNIGQSDIPYESALSFLKNMRDFNYTYQWSWLGVPIIKLPEDIMVMQEFFGFYKPNAVIETGIARGGGLKLYFSLQKILALDTNVLGIDLKIFEHTINALGDEIAAGLKMVEADSISNIAIQAVTEFISEKERILMILDGDHSHRQVLAELRIYGKLLPIGSYIVVADTITEDINLAEKPRPWGKGNNPKTALQEFLSQDGSWVLDPVWGRRATISESRDGWIVKTK